MTTNILLTLIAVLLAVRIVLQIRQGKRAFEKMHQAKSEVINSVEFVALDELKPMLYRYSRAGCELVNAMPYTMTNGEFRIAIFFTCKKIKNYYEK